MKLYRLYAVIAMPDDVAPEDVVDNVFADDDDVYFACAREGYAGEFAEFGADPSSWGVSPTPPRCGPGCPGFDVLETGEVVECETCRRAYDSGDSLYWLAEKWVRKHFPLCGGDECEVGCRKLAVFETHGRPDGDGIFVQSAAACGVSGLEYDDDDAIEAARAKLAELRGRP